MTKVVKWWQKVSFWMKLKIVIGAFGAGGEITMIATDQLAKWHVVTIVATILSVVIAQIIEDKDGNGVADIFQKKTNNGKVN